MPSPLCSVDVLHRRRHCRNALASPPPASVPHAQPKRDTLTTQAARNANATFTFLRNLPHKAVAIYLNELDLSVARVRPSETAEFDRVAAVGVMPEVPHLPSPPPTLIGWHACLSVPVVSPRGPASAPHSVHGSCREPSLVSHSPTPAAPFALRGQIKPVAKRPRGRGRPRLV